MSLPSAPGPSAVGSCPAWRVAASTVETALRAGDAVLVLGERGTGRATLLAEQFGQIHPDGHTVSIAAQTIEVAPGDIADQLVRPTSQPVLYVLHDVDTLSRKAIDALAKVLGDAPAHLAATATDAVRSDALLALFHASATVPPRATARRIWPHWSRRCWPTSPRTGTCGCPARRCESW